MTVVVAATGGIAAGPMLAATASVGAHAGIGAATVGATGAAVGGGTALASVGTGVVIGAGTEAVAGAEAGAVAGAAGGALIGTAIVAGGPIVWGLAIFGTMVVGTKTEQNITFDCWKAIVHDTSPEPSNGCELQQILANDKIVSVEMGLDSFILCNKWGEVFSLEPVILPGGEITLHAVQVQGAK